MSDSRVTQPFPTPSRPSTQQPFRQFRRWELLAWPTGLILLDQATKELARLFLRGTAPKEYLDIWVFQYAENSGAFLSLGANLSPSVRFWLLQVGVLLFLLYAAWKLWADFNLNRWARWGWMLMAAGGLGNWVDRAISGRVTDFMIFHLGSLSTGIFNVADMYIVAAVALFVLENQLVRKWGS